MTSGNSGNSALTGIQGMAWGQPRIDSVVPNVLPLLGGSVTINGSGFLPGATVQAGLTNLTGVTVNASGTQITATVPALTVGLFGITVTNNNASLLTVTVPGLLTIIL